MKTERTSWAPWCNELILVLLFGVRGTGAFLERWAIVSLISYKDAFDATSLGPNLASISSASLE